MTSTSKKIPSPFFLFSPSSTTTSVLSCLLLSSSLSSQLSRKSRINRIKRGKRKNNKPKHICQWCLKSNSSPNQHTSNRDRRTITEMKQN